jgi:hypothetical protein
MVQSQSCRIQAEAAEALAEWKAFFAEQVAEQAKELAKDTNPPGLITLDHYRQAATLAVQALATAVQDTGSNDDRQEAA